MGGGQSVGRGIARGAQYEACRIKVEATRAGWPGAFLLT